MKGGPAAYHGGGFLHGPLAGTHDERLQQQRGGILPDSPALLPPTAHVIIRLTGMRTGRYIYMTDLPTSLSNPGLER